MSKQKKINIQVLHAGLYFQKEPNKTRVNQIATNFDWNIFQPLDVSYRDGKYNVVNGQHRLSAMKQRFGEDSQIQVPCCVRDGLSRKAEMDLFVDLATKSRKVSCMELFKAQYADGLGDDDVVNMYNIVNNTKVLTIDWKENKGMGRITAIQTIFGVYEDLNDKFEEYIDILHKTWKGDTKYLQVPILKGLCEFVKRYEGEYDSKTFIKKLSQYSPEDIIREGKSDLTSKTEIGVGKSIFNKYNKGLKEKSRLESKW
jgi:hypothetical protein